MKFYIEKKTIYEALKNANTVVGNENDINLILSSIYFQITNDAIIACLIFLFTRLYFFNE